MAFQFDMDEFFDDYLPNELDCDFKTNSDTSDIMSKEQGKSIASGGEGMDTNKAFDTAEQDSEPFKDKTKMNDYVLKQRNKNTTAKINQNTRKFEAWLKEKGVTRNILQIPPVQLDNMVSEYLLHLTKKANGDFYEPDTLTSIFRFVQIFYSIKNYLTET